MSKKAYSKSGSDVILTPEKYSKVLIWLPGVGDVPESYKELFISDAVVPNDIKVIILCPPVKPFTLSNNKSITNWFDVYKPGFKDENYYNFSDAVTSSNRIIKIIKNESKKLNNDFSKIYIGGFSQGACMALYMGLATNFKIGGVIACSGILFHKMEINEDNKDIKIFIGHGDRPVHKIAQGIGQVGIHPLHQKLPGNDTVIFKRCTKHTKRINLVEYGIAQPLGPFLLLSHSC